MRFKFLSLVFCLLSMLVNVFETAAQESELDREVRQRSEHKESIIRYHLGYHTFTNESTSESYGSVPVGAVEVVGWGERYGASFEMGHLECEGTPPMIDSDWIVDDSWCKMNAIYMGFNVLYSFTGVSDSGLFKPYAGIGPVIWLGSERISADAWRRPAGVYESFHAELLGFGVSYGGCAMIGSDIRVTEKISILVELRGILGSSESMAEIPEEEEEEDFNSSLYSVVARPDFNFTGWRFDIGFQW